MSLRVASRRPGSLVRCTEIIDFFHSCSLETLSGLAFYAPEVPLYQLSGQPPPLAHGVEPLVQTLIAAGLLDQAPDWGRLIDPEPARRVMNAGNPS